MERGDIQLLWFLAGLLHMAQLPAMAVFFKQILRMGPDLARLSITNRQIVYVMAVAVVMLVLGTGIVVMIGAEELALGRPHARALATLLALFWGLRAGVQLLVYARSWPATPAGRTSHALLSLLFCAKAALYSAALAGMISS